MVPPDGYEPGGPRIGVVDNAHYRLVDQALRNAWRQRKARSKRISTKAYNFVLSVQSKLKLDQIAGNRFSTIGEALELLINDEAARIAEHKEAQKQTHKIVSQLREKHKAELSESNNANIKVQHALEVALQVQTMKLTIANLELERPTSKHLGHEVLKEEAIKHFHVSWSNVIASMGSSALGLIARTPNDELLWSRIAGSCPDGTSNISREGSS
jgi:hypothetical protein